MPNNPYTENHCYITEVKGGKNPETHVYVDDYIESPENYRNLFTLLQKAEEDDTITFIVNSRGGEACTLFQMLQSIEKCEAKTVAHVHTAMSASVLLFLACDEIYLSEYCEVLIHNWRGDDRHDKSQRRHALEKFDELFKKVADKYWNNLLTAEEMEMLWRGDVEVILLYDELLKRAKDSKLAHKFKDLEDFNEPPKPITDDGMTKIKKGF